MDVRCSFDTLAESLEPDETRAMILFEENRENEGVRLWEDLRPLAGRQATFKPVNGTAPRAFLVCLPAERLCEAVLRLTEQGIKRLKAVQPVSVNTSLGEGK